MSSKDIDKVSDKEVVSEPDIPIKSATEMTSSNEDNVMEKPEINLKL